MVTLSAFDVRPTCDTADVQAILPFPPNPLKHILCDVPDCGVTGKMYLDVLENWLMPQLADEEVQGYIY